MTLAAALQWASAILKAKRIDSPRLTSELLLGFVLGLSRLDLAVRSREEIKAGKLKEYQKLINKRAKHIPLQHLMGTTAFLNFEVSVNKAVLIPRPETEEVFEFFIKEYEKLPKPRPTILDLGTGSGVLAIALARRYPKQMIYACDISPKALVVAQKNAERLKVKNIRWYQGSFLEAFPRTVFQSPVWLISNPPYIALNHRRKLSREVLHDPKRSLFAGSDGLAAFKILSKQFLERMAPGSTFISEIGFDQKQKVTKIFQSLFEAIEIHRDLNGKNRILYARNFLNTL